MKKTWIPATSAGMTLQPHSLALSILTPHFLAEPPSYNAGDGFSLGCFSNFLLVEEIIERRSPMRVLA